MGQPTRVRGAAGSRLPLVVFGVVEVVALPLLLHAGRRRWFIGDDWFFLTNSGGFKSLLKTNTYGHWLTLPFLAYRLLWWLFGLRQFRAFLLLVILLHLTTAALLRVVMRRCDAGPWISTVAASVLVFLGAGAFNIFVPSQISFDGSMVFGLMQLLLADHDGTIDRRDFAGLACGLAGLMCSNVSIAMVAAVGVAALLRRGWRPAVFHTSPLGAAYVAWWFAYARGANGLLRRRASPGDLMAFIWRGVGATFEGIGHFPLSAIVLAAIFVVGLAVAWAPGSGFSRRRNAPAAGLAIAAVVFIASAGLIRANPANTPGGGVSYYSRYVYVSVAMVLPVFALALTALTRRWRIVGPIAILVLLAGLPGSYRELTDFAANFPGRYRHRFLVLAHSPIARSLPRGFRVAPAQGGGYMTTGWLVAGAESGRIPGPGEHVSPEDVANATLNLELSVYQVAPHYGRCRRVRASTLVLQVGQQILATRGTFGLVYVTATGRESAPLWVVAFRRFQAHLEPLTLRIVAGPADAPFTLLRCTGRPGR